MADKKDGGAMGVWAHLQKVDGGWIYVAMEMGFPDPWDGKAGRTVRKPVGFRELVIAWLPPSGGKPSTKGKSGTNEFHERRILYGRITVWKERGSGSFCEIEVGQRLSTPDRIAQGFPLASSGRPPARYLSLIKRHPLDLQLHD